MPDRRQQVLILLKKNFLQITQNKVFIYSHVFITLVMFMFLVFTDFLFKHYTAYLRTVKYNLEPLKSFKRCSSPNCLNLGLAILSQKNNKTKKWINNTIKDIKSELNLNSDADVQMVYKGNDIFEIDKRMEKFSQVQNMVYFCNDWFFVKNNNFEFSCDKIEVRGWKVLGMHSYLIAYNSTNLFPSFI